MTLRLAQGVLQLGEEYIYEMKIVSNDLTITNPDDEIKFSTGRESPPLNVSISLNESGTEISQNGIIKFRIVNDGNVNSGMYQSYNDSKFYDYHKILIQTGNFEYISLIFILFSAMFLLGISFVPLLTGEHFYLFPKCILGISLGILKPLWGLL